MGILDAAGFLAAGGSMGIKPSGVDDVAVVASASGAPLQAAAVFTTNKACAAPVQVSRRHLEATGGRVSAVVLTSGNANAATGATGLEHAEALCATTAQVLGCAAEEVLVCQTGLIGIPFPFEATIGGLAPVVEARAGTPEAGAAAARAILTTDTIPKEVTIQGEGFTIGGMAKGAAMLAPNMATMLAVLTTDAALSSAELSAALRAGVEHSFNRLHTDGATSTNDTVVLLASGLAGPVALDQFTAAVAAACSQLAQMMADDAEGATKVVHVTVTGARSDAEAHLGARKVADSQLVKCSFNGADPYWGRVLSELGTAGIDLDPALVSIRYGGIEVCAAGVAARHDAAALEAVMAERHLELACNLGLGSGAATVLTVDLSYGYIDENRTTS